MRAVALLLVAGLTAAGCIGPDEPIETASVDAPGIVADAAGTALARPIDKNASVDVPEWRAGDAWTIEATDGTNVDRSTLVVTTADASAYHVHSTSEQMASFDAMFDVSYLGRIRASDLAGHQADQPVRFFDFPLAHGKSWTATWDGLEVALSAAFVPSITTPLGPQPGFIIQGLAPDGSNYVLYDYVPALKWWSQLQFQEGYGLKVTGVASNWTGEYAMATAKTLLTLAPAVPGAAMTPAGTFTVDEGQTTVAMTTMGYAEAYARGLVVIDPENVEHAGPHTEHSAAPAGTFDVRMLPAKPGQWKIAAPTAYHNGGFAILVQQVAVEKHAL